MPDDPAPTHPQPGDIVAGKYRVDGILGRGGMGVVVAATHVKLAEQVAIKFLLTELGTEAEATARFEREARAAVRIRSEHVARVLDVGTLDSGVAYIVMEHLEGADLGRVVKQQGPLAIEDAVGHVLQACEALAEAHAAGIIHRDLKPANIFCTRALNGETMAKILDFGISKVFDTGHNFTLTRTGTVVGSPAYMSPEQAGGREDIDGRADIWSLGVVMYEALTGTLPHQAANYNALMVRILTQDCDPIVTRKTDLPPSVCAIVDACLRRERDERTSSAGILANQMEGAVREMRTVRFRAHGRRASDRAQGQFRRRATDYAPEGAAMVSQRRGALSQRNAVILAASAGVAVGVVALLLVLMVLRH
jgi:eukaryotic-like serine/threonine-protein kinase